MGDGDTVTHRFFRSTEQVYESARATIDAAWGLPANGQQTCIEPAETAPRDATGNVLLAIMVIHCNIPPVDSLLSGSLQEGLIEEIDEATYMAAFRSAE